MPPVPQRDGDDDEEQGGISGLTDDQDSSPSPMPSGKDQARGFVALVREIHTNIEDVAKQFPAFSKYADKAQKALIEGMTKVVATLNQPGGSDQSGSSV